MKKAAVCLLFTCIAILPAAAQSRSGRARTVATPTPPPVVQNAPASSERRPVLADRSRPVPTPTPSNSASEDDVVRVDTDLVTTPVSVLDRNGRFIPGLKKKDFKIFENDVPQTITYFQSEEQPFTVVLMIDISPSTKYAMDDIHYAALTFVNQLRPADKVMVVAFDQRVHILTEPTGDRQRVYAAIYRAQFGSGTSIYDAVTTVANLDVIKEIGRKAVVMFTDGVDTTSRSADYQSSVQDVEEIDALVYPIHYNTQQQNNNAALAAIASLPPGIQLPPDIVYRIRKGQSAAEYETGKEYLETLATNSGGRIFEADSIQNLETSFAGIAEELRRQYSVGYYAEKAGQPGERKRIKILVSRPNVVTRSKTSYIVHDKSEDSPQPRPQSMN